jgi:hypothetical protein
MGTLNAILIATGLERCEFDDECDYCDSPEQGSYVRLHHIPEDGTEADFYICGACIMDAIDDYRRNHNIEKKIREKCDFPEDFVDKMVVSE